MCVCVCVCVIKNVLLDVWEYFLTFISKKTGVASLSLSFFLFFDQHPFLFFLFQNRSVQESTSTLFVILSNGSASWFVFVFFFKLLWKNSYVTGWLTFWVSSVRLLLSCHFFAGIEQRTKIIHAKLFSFFFLGWLFFFPFFSFLCITHTH